MDWVRGHPARPDASETLAYPGIAWVRGHPARPDASETLAYPGIRNCSNTVNDHTFFVHMCICYAGPVCTSSPLALYCKERFF
jgi:hypothetical protein